MLFQILLTVVGVFVLSDAAWLIATRRRRDMRLYGTPAALAFHTLAVGCLGGLLIASAAKVLSLEALGVAFLAIGAADVLVGALARRQAP